MFSPFPGSQIQGGQPVIGSLSPKGADQGHMANVIRFNAGTSWRPLSPLMESSAAFCCISCFFPEKKKKHVSEVPMMIQKGKVLELKSTRIWCLIVAKEAKQNRFCRGVPFSEMFEWHRDAN